jgi:serine/threonine protein kinase
MSESTIYRNSLPLQAMLNEYRVESVLGAGGFGMTYLGWDTNLEKHVAIKEYLPTDLAVRALDGSVVPVTTEHEHDYKWGLDRFILEARTLAKFGHPHIVRVIRYFEANGTGYMVMDYEKGMSMNQLLKAEPFPEEAQLKAVLLPLLDGLDAVHGMGFLHRDIKPSNIFIRENGVPVLIDFGAARQASGSTKSLTAVLTPGYAPLEQYTNDGRQGPWSDIYAMSGVIFRAMTNKNPPDAVSRLRDDTVVPSLSTVTDRYSVAFLRSVAWAMSVDEGDRPQCVGDWKAVITGNQPAPPAALALTIGGTTAAPLAPSSPSVRRASPVPAQTAGASGAKALATPAQGRDGKGGWARSWLAWGIGAVALLAVLTAWNKHRTLPTAAEASPVQAVARQAAEPEAVPQPRVEPVVASIAPVSIEPPATEPAVEEAPVRERPSVERKRDGKAPVREGVPLPPLANPSRERPGRDRVARSEELEPRFEQMKRKAAEEFSAVDSNGDGFLTRSEVQSRMPFVHRMFDRIDTDGDGRISSAEFWRMKRLQAESFQSRR